MVDFRLPSTAKITRLKPSLHRLQFLRVESLKLPQVHIQSFAFLIESFTILATLLTGRAGEFLATGREGRTIGKGDRSSMEIAVAGITT